MNTNVILLAAALVSAPCAVLAQEPAPVEATAQASAYAALNTEQKAVVDNIVTLCDQTTDTVKEILLGIKDRASADAAAPRLQAAFDALDAAWDEIPTELLPAIRERIAPQKAKAQEVDALIKGLLHQETPFFSSIALASALGTVETQEVNVPAPGPAPQDTPATGGNDAEKK